MKSYTILSCFLIFLCLNLSTSITAQRAAILNNPEITWVAEFTIDYSFSLKASTSTERVKLFKLLDDGNRIAGANNGDWPVRWIAKHAFSGEYDCYKDPGLTQKLSPKKLEFLITSVDTVITFDPSTFEESITIVRRERSPYEISHLRVNQLIFYNKKNQQFGTTITSIAPLMRDENGDLNQVSFWIKMDQAFNSDFDAQSNAISWAALVYSKRQPLNINFMEVIKNEDDINFKDFIYEQAKSLIHPVSFDFEQNDMIDQNSFKMLYNSVDTVTTFDPETYEEEVRIIKNEIDPKGQNEFRLVQKWYYDREKKTLTNQLISISPMIQIKDDAGKYKYSRPIYYIRYN